MVTKEIDLTAHNLNSRLSNTLFVKKDTTIRKLHIKIFEDSEQIQVLDFSKCILKNGVLVYRLIVNIKDNNSIYQVNQYLYLNEVNINDYDFDEVYKNLMLNLTDIGKRDLKDILEDFVGSDVFKSV